MEFRTELSLRPSRWNIDLNDPILTVGSCFADSIGEKFIDNKFKALVNPFGATYHPFSIHRILKYAACQEYPLENTFLEKDRIQFNYNFHSSFNASTLAELQESLRQSIASVHHYLKNCKVLIITYGTSWIYERVDTGEAVANCHKLPAALFTKRLANHDEIISSFDDIYKTLKSINSSLHVILTVSPVRHLKDSIVLNNVSKSILNVVCHSVASKNADVEYFPAFEIMMDDLRDYRFYKNDLIHPTNTAIDYIWEKFSLRYFDEKTHTFLDQWKEISKALTHRPFQSSSESHQKFLATTLKQLEELKSQANVDEEIKQLRSQLI